MFIKTTIAAAALTVMVAAPAMASGDDSFGIDDRYNTATNYDLPQAQVHDRYMVQNDRVYMHRTRDPVARYERMLNRNDQTGNH